MDSEPEVTLAMAEPEVYEPEVVYDSQPEVEAEAEALHF